jgi:2-polyprenyl-3-methyl-5-hydroxy-6-metoxy-1,4-benzoquinol methylase
LSSIVPDTNNYCRRKCCFLQKEYIQGFTTDMPSPEELKRLKETGFKGTEKDYSEYITILSALGCKPGDSLLDYGCSWGYGSWQFHQAGYRVTAFEISAPRCDYARRRLEINAYRDLALVTGPFDIFFSAHVLEHVPSVSQSVEFARQVLGPGGWFVAFTPNGSNEFRRVNPRAWNQLWGAVHPNFLDSLYYESLFQFDTYLIATTPYDLASIKKWALTPHEQQKSASLSLSGDELLIIVRFSIGA